MQYHHQFHHPRKYKKTKFLFLFLSLAIFAIFGFKYFNKSSSYIDNTKDIATTTPVVSKPKPTTGGSYFSIYPDIVRQGDPALIIVEGIASTSSVKTFTFDNRPLISFIYEGKIAALLGVDLYSTVGKFPLVLTLQDGREVKGEFVISQRPEDRRSFDIPEKLGGNTSQSIKNLVSTLAEEGKIINAIPTSNKRFWIEKFRSPLDIPIVVADVYGYTRVIGNFTMPHKGTDLEAPIGTPVYSMNKGMVRFADTLRNYGDTVVVDHGVGLQTVYMHLSEIKVKNDQIVERGEIIGLSGDTGYVLNPHLHVTVRIWDVSIDTMKFLELLGEN